MYHNEITYADKWKTEENRQALEKLRMNFLEQTPCMSDCPLSWAVEVLALLEKIKDKLGADLSLEQVKEKYGELRIYYSNTEDKVSDDVVDSWIEETEIQLARKGAYYSLKSLYTSSTTRYDGNEPKTTYPYRKYLTDEEIRLIQLDLAKEEQNV